MSPKRNQFFRYGRSLWLRQSRKNISQAIKDLKIPREKIIVTIKIYMSGSDPNDIGEGRKHIIEGTKNSLKKLQLDYCDVVYAHRYDMNTPIEETVRAMNYLIEKGLAFYWATSEWTADQIERAFNICKERNLIPPICDQAHYNLLYRENIDSNYRDLFKYRKYGITSFSPLEYGILTGKYFDDKSKDSERSKMGFMREWDKNKKDWEPKLKKLQQFAKEKLNCTLAQLSIAWVIQNKDISTAILGAKKPEQLNENLKALEIVPKLTEEILEEIENIMGNTPPGEIDYFNNFKPLPIRRKVQK